MTAERWKQIKTIFYQTVETAPDKRGVLLAEICGEDGDLREEVESLLQFEHQSAESFEEPIFDAAVKLLTEDDLPTDAQIDNYRIGREIGHGGMGAVYLATRTDGLFEQKVALKIIKRGMDTDSIVKRFTMERQILASLDHPNIARLFDGGTTDGGLPYFVMEYVEGLPVLEFCSEQNLSLNERLKLFRKICSTVAFAHQNLVIHRDLKPSNILVNRNGEPKLLDFGIAKLLHSEPSGETEFTETANRMLTPEYASPEQISGGRITTQSDVFSLGVLLSKLVQSPKSEVQSTSKLKISNYKFQTKDQKPKTELEAILQTALHTDLTRRYSSVEQFSEDIRRFLEGLPIFARKDSFAYRTAKFVYRNQPAVFAAAFMIFALAAATVFSVWQARRANAAQQKAERRFNDVRKIAGKVIFDYHDKIQNLSGATGVRRQMLQDSIEYLDDLSQEAANDSGLLSEIGTAYLKIGDVQGKPFEANAGDSEGALESYRKAERIFLKLTETDANRREFQINLTRAWDAIGGILVRQIRLEEAIELHRKSLSVREKLLNENPLDNDLRELTAKTSINLGDAIAVKSGQFSPDKDFQIIENLQLESLEFFRRALSLRQAVAAENQSAENLRRVGGCLQRIGFRLVSIGDFKKNENFHRQGLENHLQALRSFETARNLEPENAKLRRSYFDQLMITAEVQTLLKDFEAARQNYLLVQKSFEKIAADDPKNIEAKRDLVNLFDRWGKYYVVLKDPPKAIENFQTAAQILSEVIKNNSTKTDEVQLKGLQWWVENAESHIAKQPK